MEASSHCSACGGDHLRKDCCHDTFCTRCRSRSHNTDMCHMHLQSLIKRTSASTVAAKVTLQESAPADQMITERNQGQHQGTSRTTEQATQVVKPCNVNINKDSHHQTRFDERYNRQYSPNYNNFQQSPLGSIPG